MPGLRWSSGPQQLRKRLEDAGLNTSFAHPIAISDANIAPSEKITGSLLGMILPMVMIVMLGVGAFYPAVDLTAASILALPTK